MRNITCSSCGKRYDYDTDDFCPKCGSYNPPADRRGQTSAPRPQAQTGPQNRSRPQTGARPAPARTPAAKSAAVRTPPPRTPQPGSGGRRPDGGVRAASSRPPWEVQDRKPIRRPVLGLTLLLLGVALLSIVISQISQGEPAPEPSQAQASAVLTQGGFADHALGEAFPYSGWTLTVETPWEPDLPASSAIPEGRCAAVDLWLSGGARIEGAQWVTPYLILEDGTQVEAVDDAPLLSRQLKSAGVYDIVPADAQWEDPLYGQLVFFVPMDAVGTATLVIPAAAAQDAVPTLHYIDITLPWPADAPAETTPAPEVPS